MISSEGMNNEINFLPILFFVLAILPGCAKQKPVLAEKKIISEPITKAQPTITVFVHGTRLFPKFALQEGFYSAPGMVKISELDRSYHVMHMIARELVRLDPERFSEEWMYAFGWHGKWSFRGRRQAAQDLYDALLVLVDKYEKQYGVKPAVRLITHSHGGNVALNLAAVKDPNNTLKIHELVILGCPVQAETKNFINDTIFIKKYVLSSLNDLIQIVDPQGLQRWRTDHFFSERWFPLYKGAVQTMVKINGVGLWHLEFIYQRFIKRLPEILDIMDVWHEEADTENDGLQQMPFPIIDLCSESVRVIHG